MYNGSRRAGSSSASVPHPKRPRLETHSHPALPQPSPYRACGACSKAKAKCEDVTNIGCHRCRSKGFECTLQGIINPDRDLSNSSTGLNLQPATATAATETIIPVMEDLGRRLSFLESAVYRIEQNIQTQIMSNQQSSAPAFSPPVFVLPKRSPDLQAFQKAMQQLPGTLFWDESVSSCWVDPRDCPNMIARGMVTQSQVEIAFQLFKHRFVSILPLSQYLLASTPPPTHPSLVIAIFSFVPEMAPSTLNDMIDETVLYSLAGAVTLDMVHAIFLMSLAPYTNQSSLQAPVTPIRLVSLAYQYGRAIGLDKKVQAFRKLDSLEDTQWDLVLLWEAIINHYNLMHILYTRRGDLPESNLQKLPSAPNDVIRQTLQHLRLQARHVDISRDRIAKLSEWEIQIQQGWLDVEAIKNLHEALLVDLDEIKKDTSHRILLYDNSFIDGSVALRISLLTIFPPTPLLPDNVFEGLTMAVRTLVKSCNRAVAMFLANPPTSPSCLSTPAYSYYGLIGACAALRRHSVLLARHGIDISSRLNIDNLFKAEDIIAHHEGLPGFIYRNMWKQLEDGDLPDKGLVKESGDLDWATLFGDFDLAGLLAAMEADQTGGIEASGSAGNGHQQEGTGPGPEASGQTIASSSSSSLSGLADNHFQSSFRAPQ